MQPQEGRSCRLCLERAASLVGNFVIGGHWRGFRLARLAALGGREFRRRVHGEHRVRFSHGQAAAGAGGAGRRGRDRTAGVCASLPDAAAPVPWTSCLRWNNVRFDDGLARVITASQSRSTSGGRGAWLSQQLGSSRRGHDGREKKQQVDVTTGLSGECSARQPLPQRIESYSCHS